MLLELNTLPIYPLKLYIYIHIHVYQLGISTVIGHLSCLSVLWGSLPETLYIHHGIMKTGGKPAKYYFTIKGAFNMAPNITNVFISRSLKQLLKLTRALLLACIILIEWNKVTYENDNKVFQVSCREVPANENVDKSCRVCTSFRNLIKSNQNQIVFTIFQLI